jgi:hypothetical protein
VEQVKSDDLTEVDAAKACRGRGHGQGFVHGLQGGGRRRAEGSQGRGISKRKPRGRGQSGHVN